MFRAESHTLLEPSILENSFLKGEKSKKFLRIVECL